MTEALRPDPQVKDMDGELLELQIGPSHPAMHGIIKLDTKVSGEAIVEMKVEVGYLHRAFEKMCEHRSWNQDIVFTDRLNYVSAPANNCAFAQAVENLAGIQVPERVKWMRLILTEMSRVADHLTSVGASAMEMGGFSAYMYLIEAREEIMMIFDRYCGSRLTTTLSRVGGMVYDFYEGFEADVARAFEKTRKWLDDVHIMLTRNRIFYDRLRGTGVIGGEKALDLGFTGPMLRASGVKYDVRLAKPYWNVEQLEFEVPVGQYGDNYDRYLVRMEEMEQSMRIVEQALERIEPGPYYVDDPKVFLPRKKDTYNHIEGLIHHFEVIMYGPKVPAGEAYFAIESPNGEHGYYVVSDGTSLPYRVRARPTCLPMTLFFPELVLGGQLADIIPTFGSINMIGGELER